MIINYLKVAIRNLLINKFYTGINITGLAIGLTSAIFIILWINDEVNYDKHYPDYNQIYRIVERQYYNNSDILSIAITPPALANELKNYEQIELVSRFTHLGQRVIRFQNRSFFEDKIGLADQDFLKLFSIELIDSGSANPMSNNNEILISQKTAQKYFGDQDAIGETLHLNNTYSFTVSGIFKNQPHNTHLKFDFLIPFMFLNDIGANLDLWGSNSYYTYIKIKETVHPELFENEIRDLVKINHPGSSTELKMQALSNIHLHSEYTSDIEQNGNILYLRLFVVIAIVIILIASINFMNLSTARSASRSVEIGLRKICGAQKRQLIHQFINESLLQSIIALLLAIVLVEILMPVFNSVSGKNLGIDYLNNWKISSLLLILTVATGIIGGIYPAILLASFRSVEVMKGRFSIRSGKFRRTMVILQFSLSIVLIISTAIIFQQMKYIQKMKLGLDKNDIVYFRILGEINKDIPESKLKFQNHEAIHSVTAISNTPTSMENSTSGWYWEGKNPETEALLHYVAVDYDFLKTFDIQLKEGRFYSRKSPDDSTTSIVINETAAKLIGFNESIGKTLSIGENNFTIIGVVNDFNFKSAHTNIEPLVIALMPDYYYFFIKLNGEKLKEGVQHIEKTWEEINPGFPFKLNWLEKEYYLLYSAEERMGRLFRYFTLLAIFVSSLGLFGLASFLSGIRTKEIGVRKALGSTSKEIILLFSKEFLQLVIIANIVAWPVAYLIMNQWLKHFAYRSNISIWIFLLAAFISVGIAFITVSYQSYKTANQKPIDALKYE